MMIDESIHDMLPEELYVVTNTQGEIISGAVSSLEDLLEQRKIGEPIIIACYSKTSVVRKSLGLVDVAAE